MQNSSDIIFLGSMLLLLATTAIMIYLLFSKKEVRS